MAPSSRARRGARRPLAALVSLLVAAAVAAAAVAAAPAAAQVVDREPALEEELRVTSVDLWIGVERKEFGAWLRGEEGAPKLAPADLELRIDGREVEIAAIGGARDDAPRLVVVYLDAVLSDQASLRWAASRLAERAEALAAHGEVEVIVADPEPRRVVERTRDVERLVTAFSSLALFAGGDAAIPLLRDQFLALSPDGAEADGELAASFVEDETALVTRQHDLALRWLADSTPGTSGSRVLLYVSQGFDPRPEDFYLGSPGAESSDAESSGARSTSESFTNEESTTASSTSEESTSAGGGLAEESRAWIRSLAAYGWTCLPLVYEDRRALLRRGFRIGKWRFHGLGGKEGRIDRWLAASEIIGATYEAERDADKAEALLELGDVELGSGAYSEAADTYLRAIHHFYGDPRTAARQAYAWRELAVALRGAGEVDRARRALANAIELDPSIEGSLGEDLATLAHEVEGLDALASETGGHLLRDGESLVAALDEIARRQRLTFTLRDAPAGELLAVELSAPSRAAPIRYSRWTRSGAPARLAAARLREFLADAASEPGGSRVSLRVETEWSGAGERVTLVLEAAGRDGVSRVLLATVGEDRPPVVVPLAPVHAAKDEPIALWQGAIDSLDDVVAAAVYTEDVVSGAWSAEAVSVENE